MPLVSDKASEARTGAREGGTGLQYIQIQAKMGFESRTLHSAGEKK